MDRSFEGGPRHNEPLMHQVPRFWLHPACSELKTCIFSPSRPRKHSAGFYPLIAGAFNMEKCFKRGLECHKRLKDRSHVHIIELNYNMFILLIASTFKGTYNMCIQLYGVHLTIKE